MNIASLHEQVKALADKKGAQLPVKIIVKGAYRYVSVLEMRGNGLLVLGADDEYDDTAGMLNDLGRHWEYFDIAIVMVEIDGKLYTILNVGMETQNWNKIAGWEECVLIEIV